MSKHHLRKDPICQNCGHTVEERYCSRCSQENVESRQSFGHLVRHVVEDITHYDGAFWRTLKYLLSRPAYLTKAYMAGKRSSYLPPVRLYIFASFLAFFLPYLLPEFSDVYKYPATKTPDTNHTKNSEYKSVRELDSLQKVLPEEKRLGEVAYWWKKKIIDLDAKSSDEFETKFAESFVHNFSKALFVFMPLFALVIFLFHSKKKWFYFDHAILTLHYFSFLLIVFTLISIFDNLFMNSFFFADEDTCQTMSNYLFTAGSFWFIAYFFRMHLHMFGEKWRRSFTKSVFILGINAFLFFILILGLVFITMSNLH